MRSTRRSTARRRISALVVTGGLIVAACSGSGSADNAVEPVARPADAGTVTTPTTSTYRAEITRTTDNVPHIVADDEGSLAFGFGYASAEDHTCKIADGILWGRGEFSQFHGPGNDEVNINRDLTYRAAGIHERATDAVNAASAVQQERLRGFAAGYNAHLADVGPDGVTGWCRGEAWLRPIDEYDLAAFHTVLGTAPTVGPLAKFIATAQPPAEGDTEPPQGPTPTTAGASETDGDADGSNSWAIGADRTEDGGAILMGNSHLSWEDRLHYYEVHLVIPGQLDVYGAAVAGFPGIVHGFNQHTAWSVTVSNGHRFTAYTLDLEPGDPTAYLYGDEVREMTSQTLTLEVAGDNGNTETIERTMWSSHYGPILNFPGVGWSDTRTLTVRDGNEGLSAGDTLFQDLATATDIDDIVAAHRDGGGMIGFNTIAADDSGEVWYGDTAATPNLSDEAIAAWRHRMETDVFTQVGYGNQVVLLDGSNPRDEWVDDPEGVRPGLMPFDRLPQLTRTDHVFNANDSYRWTNQDELLDGYTPLNGPNDRVSPRTRMNALQLSRDGGGAGDDGLFSLQEVQDSVLANRVFTAEKLADQVLERCAATPEVAVDGVTVDLTEACEVLASWDRTANLESRGAILWREFINRPDAGPLYADTRDDDRYVATPALLAEGDGPLIRLAGAVQTLRGAGHPLDVAVGDVQFAYRGNQTVPLHGGAANTGVMNRVSSRPSEQTSEPGTPRGSLVEGSDYLRTDGYPVSGGTSYLLAVELTPNGPEASAILVYGNTGDVESDDYAAQTVRFAEKNWRTVAYDQAAIDAETLDSYVVVGDR